MGSNEKDANMASKADVVHRRIRAERIRMFIEGDGHKGGGCSSSTIILRNVGNLLTMQ